MLRIKTNVVVFFIAVIMASMTSCGEGTKNFVSQLTDNTESQTEFQTGDIVFQESKSAQSKYIKKATGSRYTHCGIIVMNGEEPFVLEASSTVKLTPFDDWKKRGVGAHVKTVKCKDPHFRVDTHKYLGKKYDTQFKWDDTRMYCSELVYKVYEDNGIKLGKLRRVKDYNISGMEKYLKKRGISTDRLVIAPSDLL